VRDALRLNSASHDTAGSAATPGSITLEDAAEDDKVEVQSAAAAAAQNIFSDALAAHDALDFATALPLLKLAGEAGHGASCGYVALYLIEGRATARDMQLAWKWANKGAEMKDADSIGLKAR
jgi:TPR repeat protein